LLFHNILFHIRPPIIIPTVDIQEDIDDLGEESGGHANPVDLPLRPRNLAGVVEVSKKNTQRKMKYIKNINIVFGRHLKMHSI